MSEPDFASSVMLLCAWVGGLLLVFGTIGAIADYIIDDKTGRVRKMRYAIVNVIALVLGYLLDKIRNGEKPDVDDHAFADDTRPALLRDQAE